MHPRITIIAALLIAIASGLAAQTTPDTVATSVDWATGTASVTITRSVATAGANAPSAIARTQRAIERDATQPIMDALSALQFDSSSTIADLVNSDEGAIVTLEASANAARPIDEAGSNDLRSAYVTFRIDLFPDLAARLIHHTRPAPIDTRLGWIAHTDYTGILIYAANELPLFGTNSTVLAQPSLFPAIYYLRGEQKLLYRVSEERNVDPSTIAGWGPAAFTSDVQATGLGERVGTNPLRILAVGVFGSTPTDIVISEEDALQIMASEHNRSLIRTGHLVIVLDPDRL